MSTFWSCSIEIVILLFHWCIYVVIINSILYNNVVSDELVHLIARSDLYVVGIIYIRARRFIDSIVSRNMLLLTVLSRTRCLKNARVWGFNDSLFEQQGSGDSMHSFCPERIIPGSASFSADSLVRRGSDDVGAMSFATWSVPTLLVVTDALAFVGPRLKGFVRCLYRQLVDVFVLDEGPMT